ncbi:MAG: glycine cleavage T C-terminal barrel domain-containing protein [Planctomycetaceae bacterium]
MTEATLETQEQAAESGCVLFPLRDWTILSITGPERHSFLHSFCTNDIKGMAAGAVCEAFITNVKGRILTHVLVLNEPEQLTLLAAPGLADSLLKHLQIYLIGLEAELRDVSASTAVTCLVGPQSEEIAESLADSEVHVSRYDFLGHPTQIVVVDREQFAAVQQLESFDGVTLGNDSGFEVLRIAAGFPLSGRDVTEENLAQEAARTAQAINFRKGCYLGQEPIARLDAMGHTNKELRCLSCDGSLEIELPCEVHFDGQTVGKLTSLAYSAQRNETVGLAMLQTRATAPGTEVTIGADGKHHMQVVSRSP